MAIGEPVAKRKRNIKIVAAANLVLVDTHLVRQRGRNSERWDNTSRPPRAGEIRLDTK